MASNFPGLRAPHDLSRFGRIAAARRMAEDDYATILANRAALRRAIQGEPEPAMSRVPSPAEFKLTSDIQKANAEPRPTSAFDVLRRELPRFFRENDELSDRVGDFSLRQGALATAGLGAGVALPATLPASLPLAARIAGGVALSNAGDALMSPGAEKVLGTDVMDPVASSLFGGVLGAKGKVIPALLAGLGASAGSAEAGGYPRRLLDLLGPARSAERFDPEQRNRMLNVLAPYARPKVLAPQASNILTNVLDDASKMNDTTVLYDQFNKPISMYSMAGRGEPFDDSEYLSGLVSLNGPRGTGRQAAQHAARNTSLGGLRLFSTPTSKGFWDKVVESEADWSKQYMPEHDLEAYRYLPPINFAGGGLASMAKNMARRSMSAIDEVGDYTTAPSGALSVVKTKGGNWLTGSVEDALKGLKKPVREDTYLAQIRAQPDAPEGMYESVLSQNAKANTLNTWIDKQLTRYVKNEMATPEDPIRALAERGVLHVDSASLPAGNRQVHPSGEHLQKLALNPEALKWENAADYAILPRRAEIYQDFGSSNMSGRPGWDWIKKLSPETQIYAPGGTQVASDLGFPHLIDELSNAINPESGLPRHLQFPADRLNKVSVPQAVERVSAINQWRAALKAEADALRANNAATQVYKEYPENNPLGLRWVELRAPTPPEGWVQEGAAWRHPDAWKKEVAKEHPWLYPNDMLQDALKYEGDMMGHCVGGYCDDVISGRTQIYSLRDAKGQPHVTIEVKPPRDKYPVSGEAFAMLPQETKDQYRAITAEWRKSNPDDPEVWKALAEAGVEPTPPSIIQIKGKQNRAPNEEYLPYVQDFVKSGQWSDVGDLQNAGLRDIGQSKINSKPYNDLAEEMFPGLRYLTDEEAEKLQQEGTARTLKERGYAQGGLVEAMIEQNLDALVEKQTPRQMSRGGSVRTPIRAKIEKMTSELRQCRN